ncbi:hypothetical protein DV737_g763, partial [Chaetothyriales sp. CBS 132003]
MPIFCFSRFLVVTWFASVAHTQCTGSTTISTSAEATALGNACETFDGRVVIDGDDTTEITLGGLSTVTGDLTCTYADDLTTLTADNLVTVGGRLSVQNNDLLSTLSFPALRNIDYLDLWHLPNLTEFSLTSELLNVTDVSIRDTALSSLNLNLSTVTRLEVEDNHVLDKISLQINSSRYASVTMNGPALRLSLPNLEIVYNLTVSNCQELEMPVLAWVNQSVGFIANGFEQLSIPSLIAVGGQLMLWNNTALSDLNLPVLTNLSGDVIIHGNGMLQNLDMPRLLEVEGDLLLNGSFTSISMPNLVDVEGDVFVTSNSSLDCSSLDPYDVSDVFKGQYRCTANQAATPSSSQAPSGGGSSLSGSAIGGIVAGVVGGLIIISAAVFFWLRSHRKNQRALAKQPEYMPSEPVTKSGFGAGPSELDAPTDKAMYKAIHAAELSAQGSVARTSELDGSHTTAVPSTAELGDERRAANLAELDASLRQGTQGARWLGN